MYLHKNHGYVEGENQSSEEKTMAFPQAKLERERYMHLPKELAQEFELSG